MKRLAVLGVLLLAALPAMGQGVVYSGEARTTAGPVAPGAKIYVCASSASLTNVPCTPQTTIYSDSGLTAPITQPLLADGNGNFTFYAPAGNYVLSITGTGLSGRTSPIAVGTPLSPAVSVDLTGLGANTGPTTLTTPLANGFYRFSCYVVLTRAATSSSTLPSCAVSYTDADSGSVTLLTQTNTSTANTVGTVGPLQSANVSYLYAKAGQTIQYSTANYASSGATSMQYSIHARLEGPF